MTGGSHIRNTVQGVQPFLLRIGTGADVQVHGGATHLGDWLDAR